MGKEINMCEDGLDLRGVPRTRFYCVETSPCKFFEWGLRGADLRESVRQGCIYVLSLMGLMLAYFENTLGVYPV